MSVATGRTYSLDLLRIIAMFMIVVLHFLGKGQILEVYPQSSLKYDAAWGLESICLVAVNCYVLISGYFLINSQFKIKKFLSLSLQVLFYSLGIYLFLLTTGIVKFSSSDLFNAVFPILTGMYWFVSVYMAMYLLSPFINKFLSKLSRRNHLGLVVLLIGIFSIWPTLFVLGDSFTFISLNIANGYSVVWFIVLYCIAAYIQRYYKPSYNFKKYVTRYSLIALSVVLLFVGSSYLGNVTHNAYFAALFTQMHGYNSFPILIASVALFMLFLNLRIKNKGLNNSIATLAPLTFAVYLIHEEPHIRSILWDTLNPSAHAFNPHFLIFALVSVITIYTVCSAIDWIRLKLFIVISKIKFFKDLSESVIHFIEQLSKRALKATERFIS